MTRSKAAVAPGGVAWRPLEPVPGEADGKVALVFDGVPFPVLFHDCPEVLDCLGRVLRGWPVQRLHGRIEGPCIEIVRDRSGYRTDAPWMDETLEGASAVATVCSLIVDLVEALVAEDPSLLCLHCGAACFDGRLVVFTGPNHMGKSTLVARLAASGVRVFCDDLLLLAAPEDHGRSFGVLGRLRMPLPDCGDAFRRFVAQHSGPRDERYLYLDTPTFASFGARAPIGAVILLDRQPGATAQWLPAGRAEALRHLVQRNLAPGETAGVTIDRLHALMTRAACARLVYSDLDEAAALIEKTFCPWPSKGIATADSLPASLDPPAPTPAGAIERDLKFHRRPDVTMRNVDGELFLGSADDDAIWHLNPLGAGIWNLLADPLSPVEAARMLSTAFPDANPMTIERDVDALFAGFVASGLIVRAGKARP